MGKKTMLQKTFFILLLLCKVSKYEVNAISKLNFLFISTLFCAKKPFILFILFSICAPTLRYIDFFNHKKLTLPKIRLNQSFVVKWRPLTMVCYIENGSKQWHCLDVAIIGTYFFQSETMLCKVAESNMLNCQATCSRQLFFCLFLCK